MSVTIYGSALSPFTRKVTLAAIEKGITFARSDLNPYSPPDNFSAMSPLKRIPILQDGDYVLNDSSAICAYLDAAYAKTMPSLIPDDPKARGYVLWIEEYADTALFDVISGGVFRPIFINQLLGKPIDIYTVKDTVQNRLPEPLTYLERQLDGKSYFSENRLTLADVSIYAQLANLEHSKQLPRADEYPDLIAHYGRLKELASVSQQFEREEQYLAAMLAQLQPAR